MLLRNTEAFLLMELAGHLKPFVGQTEDVTTPALKKFGEPVVQKLVAHHGYSRPDAGAVVLQAWKTLCKERGVPWRIAASRPVVIGMAEEALEGQPA